MAIVVAALAVVLVTWRERDGRIDLARITVAEAAERTLRSDSALVDVVVRSPLPRTGEDAVAFGCQVSFRAGTSRCEVDLTNAQWLVGPTDSDAHMTSIQQGLVQYTQPARYRDDPALVNRWRRYHWGPSITATGIDPTISRGLNAYDPITTLELLRAIDQRPEELGVERLDDTPTRRVRFKVDYRQLLLHSGAVFDEWTFERSFTDYPLGEFPLDVWIDRRGRVRRTAISWLRDRGTFTSQMTFRDFDSPVDSWTPPPEWIEPPPATTR